ncbi:hypothetical protein Tco_1157382, partial [Tanacetum coccineum]
NRVMSSPSHPSSNIEDAISSNFPNSILSSPDYVLASPRKTNSEQIIEDIQIGHHADKESLLLR